jgi:hypothetical protein
MFGSATGTGRRREATPCHAPARIARCWCLNHSHAGSLWQNNLCTANIQRSGEIVNEMAVHI